MSPTASEREYFIMLASLRTLLPRLEHGPGIAAAATTAGLATVVASQLPSNLHISAIPVSIVIGACAGNAMPSALTTMIKPGLGYATSTILRTGIVCVGAKLSAAQILALGWTTVPAAACSVAAGVTIIPMLAARAGLAPRLGTLLAAGTSICGVTAISAVAPAIAATQAEVAIAVANVVAFGSVGMLVYPHVAASGHHSNSSTSYMQHLPFEPPGHLVPWVLIAGCTIPEF